MVEIHVDRGRKRKHDDADIDTGNDQEITMNTSFTTTAIAIRSSDILNRQTLPVLPPEILLKITTLLPGSTLKSIRRLNKSWSMSLEVLKRLFSSIAIFAHPLVLEHFVTTFLESRVRNVVQELEFATSEFNLDHFHRHMIVTYWKKKSKRDVDGEEVTWDEFENRVDGEDEVEDVYQFKQSSGMALQLATLPLLRDVVHTVPDVRRVSIVRLEPVLRRNIPDIAHFCPQNRKDCVDCSREDTVSCAPHPKFSLAYMRYFYQMFCGFCAWAEGPKGIKLKHAMPGTIVCALATPIARTRIDSLSIYIWEDPSTRLMDLLTESERDLNKLENYHINGSHRVKSVLTNLRDLDIKFRLRFLSITRTQRAYAQMYLFEATSNLRTLRVTSEPKQWKIYGCHHHREYCGLDVMIFGLIENVVIQPLFPRLLKLHLYSSWSNSQCLLHLVQTHCPKLRILVFQKFSLTYRAWRRPDCWVQFLKKLKHTCGARIKELDFRDYLGNSSLEMTGNPSQHWHGICSKEGAANASGQKWFKNQILEWFHDLDASDESCPLNAWELDEESGMYLTSIGGQQEDNGELLRHSLVDESWGAHPCPSLKQQLVLRHGLT